MKTKPLLAIACGALVALALPAVAQDGPAKKTLTRDQYRACLDSADKLKARGEDIKARTDKLKSEIDAISAENDEIQKLEQKQKDMVMSAGDQRRFERRKAANTARGKASDEAKKTLTDDMASYTKEVEAYNGGCTGVSVYPQDREAVEKEREAAGKK